MHGDRRLCMLVSRHASGRREDQVRINGLYSHHMYRDVVDIIEQAVLTGAVTVLECSISCRSCNSSCVVCPTSVEAVLYGNMCVVVL